ncbi:lytic murein transglycosylase [Saccharomonospora sp. NPDC046836]|uniref:lytic transglycosylase domain-containing protein n=1 Tax=Saccharomonospora sp. NPDC046836 TaxID=3156921 RepID=UPI0033EEEB14
MTRRSGVVRRFGLRHKVCVATLGGTLAMLPVAAVSDTASNWGNPTAAEFPGHLAPDGGYAPGQGFTSVDGSLPEQPNPQSLATYDLPSTGTHGIPSTALEAYRKAARMVGAEFPGCNIDWALIASIGRIESNHARGGYVDADGNTLEPILGPVLNGVGPVAAIRDTDDGRYDGDTEWDRAVGPTQFIPGTWARYGSDGNGDGVRDPHNIYDATVASARYLCSGGLDLAQDDQLRAALFRYNNSQSYVETVIQWAEAYRGGVRPSPDSNVPLGVPPVVAAQAPAAAAQPAAPNTTVPPTSHRPSPTRPSTSQPESQQPGSQLPGETSPGSPTTTTSPSDPASPTTTLPPDSNSPTTTTPPTTTTTDPSCETETTTPTTTERSAETLADMTALPGCTTTPTTTPETTTTTG